MTREEYEKVKAYTYEEYCEYLDKKYCNIHKFAVHPEYNGVYLFKHHTLENKKANLSDPEIAKTATEKERNTITLCDFLEHLFLHILIGEQTDARNALGIGGAIAYIIPQIENYFEMGDTSGYAEEYFSNLDYDLFEELKDRCDNALEEINVALDHNQTVYLEAKNYLNTKGKALVVIGTGLGKTTTALEYLKEFKCRALVIGPNNLIKSGWEEYAGWVDVTTYQTFANEYNEINYNQYGLVIIDEAHHAGFDESTGKGAKVWSAGIKYILDKGVKVLGLTATPERSDGINIGDTLFEGCVCEGFAVEDGIEKGIIYPFSYVTAYYDTTGLLEKYSNCDNKELIGQLDLAINNTPTVKDIFKSRMPEGKRKGIVFIQEIEDEQNVLNIMKDVYPQIEMRIIHSKMSDSEVAANRDWFEKTGEGYLLAVNMISEGAHYKGVNTLIMFRRTNSYLVFTQQLGRIITLTKNENPNAIVFDLVNNIENVEYGNRKKDEKEHSIKKIIKALKNTNAFKSDQIIVADETRDIVKCIREIKEYADYFWAEYEINILRKYYPKEGSACSDKLPKRSIYTIRAMAQKLGIKFIRWTEYEDSIIKEFYSLYGAKKCKEKLPDKSIPNIISRANNLKIYYIDWLPEEINIIKNNSGTISKDEWKILLPRKTYTAIKKKAKELNVSITARTTLWTPEEDEIIKTYYKELRGNLEELLPHRSNKNIAQRARKLGIELLNRWTEKENQFLIENYLSKGVEYCAKCLNRSKNVVLAFAHRLGLYPSRRKILCLELNKTYNSQSEAQEELKINHLSHALKTGGISGGYHFCYEDEFIESGLSAEDYIKKNAPSGSSKRVLCVETKQIFNSAAEAMDFIGIRGVDACCRGKQKTAGGYHWKYVEEKK